jgi:3-ketosteroid 9alpha-monooxygenase subunit A
LYKGWSQVAYAKQLTGDLTPVFVGGQALVLVRQDGQVRAFDAACPHRGANLGHGGELVGEAIVCPFHGRRIALGCNGSSRYHVREYRALTVSGCVFVLLSEQYEHGFTEYLTGLSRTHHVMPGFTLSIKVAPEYVIENIFDAEHFSTVHGLRRRPDLVQRPSTHGEMVVEGDFETPNDDDTASVFTRFHARVFSPTLAASELGDEGEHSVVITAATPTPEGHSVVRVSIALPPKPDGSPASLTSALALLRDSETAFEQDRPIWENLCHGTPHHLDASDSLVIAYHDFCRRLGEAA